MNNNYEVAELIELGKAQDVILGSTKLVQIFDDSPLNGYRNQEEEQDDE